MKSCCDSKSEELKALQSKQSAVLKIVLLLNLSMFFIEGAYGIMGRSTSLLADSLDMLGDAFVYGFSIYAIGKSPRWGASASLLKGSIMLLFGMGVMADALRRYFAQEIPVALTMGLIGTLALAVNVTCALLLLRYRNDDLNMRSTWLCSRKDVIANIGILLAAGAVSLLESRIPDLVVGAGIAILVLKSSYEVLKEATAALRETRNSEQAPVLK